jgi:hypothetical protein
MSGTPDGPTPAPDGSNASPAKPCRRSRLVLRLTRREQADYKPILDATRVALKSQCDLTLVVQTCPDPDPPALPQEQLETVVRATVAGVLDAIAEQEAAKQQEPSLHECQQTPPQRGSKWWAMVKAFGKFLADNGLKVWVSESAKKAAGG